MEDSIFQRGSAPEIMLKKACCGLHFKEKPKKTSWLVRSVFIFECSKY
jgi:hypothetical protein